MIFISSCCSYDKSDFYFNDKESNHLSVYKIGDTVYFKNQQDDIDTILIKNIETEQHKECGIIMARAAENNISVIIEHLPIDKWHGMTYSEDESKINYQSIVSISKYPQQKKTIYSISFKDFCNSTALGEIGEYHSDTITINKKKIFNYYIVRHGYPERVIKSDNIEVLYWTDKDGLIAYKNKKGDWWTKESYR